MKSLITVSIGIGLLAVIAYGIFSYSTLKQQEVRSQAVDGCYKASLYRNTRTTEEGTITTEDVIEPSFMKCMQNKGLSL